VSLSFVSFECLDGAMFQLRNNVNNSRYDTTANVTNPISTDFLSVLPSGFLALQVSLFLLCRTKAAV
jgi:hypothetical protein